MNRPVSWCGNPVWPVENFSPSHAIGVLQPCSRMRHLSEMWDFRDGGSLPTLQMNVFGRDDDGAKQFHR
ncbi:hypothetical protein MTR67_029711 [Solanum verrucosum]|uniref:Uncharacterized protein n=1 Tax=Solanum verrucosum TaxID=315347 RepID=A0AAF0RD48_SOLVR|nr:hypothetical protein MTR67_029711 [Solanum verrucosum]